MIRLVKVTTSAMLLLVAAVTVYAVGVVGSLLLVARLDREHVDL